MNYHLNTPSRILAILAVMLFSCINGQAQNGVNSPYSRYGFGMMADRSMGFNKGMGGIAQGYRESNQINPANPASYSAVDSITALFDIGMTLSNGNYKMGNLQQNVRNTSFDYFAFQFRAWRNVGMSVGLLPYTNLNYNFSSAEEKLEGTESTTSSYNFNGSGGLHQVYYGIGWRPFTPISIGANVSYLFGDYTHTSTSSVSDVNAYSLVRGYKADIGTYMLNFGAQYTLKINTKDILTIGATYGLGHEVKNRAYRYTESLGSGASIQGITNDTLKNAFELPMTIAAGVTYKHGTKWFAGADFELEKWGDCKFPNQISDGKYASEKGVLNDRLRVALGGSYTPNNRSPKLFKRSSYRLGGYWSQSYAQADATGTIKDKPIEYGVSAGISMPLQSRWLWHDQPRVNVSVQWVHTDIPYLNVQSFGQSKLTENYLRLSIGVSLSERWFNKWKVQ